MIHTGFYVLLEYNTDNAKRLSAENARRQQGVSFKAQKQKAFKDLQRVVQDYRKIEQENLEPTN